MAHKGYCANDSNSQVLPPRSSRRPLGLTSALRRLRLAVAHLASPPPPAARRDPQGQGLQRGPPCRRAERVSPGRHGPAVAPGAAPAAGTRPSLRLRGGFGAVRDVAGAEHHGHRRRVRDHLRHSQADGPDLCPDGAAGPADRDRGEEARGQRAADRDLRELDEAGVLAHDEHETTIFITTMF